MLGHAALSTAPVDALPEETPKFPGYQFAVRDEGAPQYDVTDESTGGTGPSTAGVSR